MRKETTSNLFFRILFCGSICLSVAACAATGRKDEMPTALKIKRVLGFEDDPYLTPIPAAPAAYREAFAKLEKRDYEAGLKGFADFLRNQPTTNWTLAAQFNQARCYEALDQLKSALGVYQAVAEKARRAPRLQGLALLRVGVILEAMGEDDRSLAALKDAERRSKSLPEEIAQTELPARLAAGYARERNFAEAERYYNLAERQLARLRAQVAKGEQPEWLPRILYAMGHRPLGEITWERFESALIPLERSQIYLLQSAELGIQPWADLAADELIGSYGALRKSIDAVPVPAAAEIVIAAREQQRERWQRLVRLSDSIIQLRSLFVGEIEKQAAADSALRKVVDFAESFEESMQSTLMLERPVGEAETPDSLRRKEEKRAKAINATPMFPGEAGESDEGDQE
jgi:tetratricopeptide (TPR) repeat protein